MKAKTLKLGLVLALCTGLCGCMTVMTVDAAGGPESFKTNANGERALTKTPKPGHYWLMPLSVTGDIITLPCQGLGILLFIIFSGGGPCG